MNCSADHPIANSAFHQESPEVHHFPRLMFGFLNLDALRFSKFVIQAR
jgi:hypothetical protein